MIRRVLSVALLSVAAWTGVAEARPPVVVELFTAQGCAACDKASASVSDLGDRPGVLPLTYSVDYWDYLGWKDTFAKPSFADRQRAYARRLGIAEVYTPQVVVDGRAQAPGGQASDIDALVRQERRVRLDAPNMEFRDDDRVAVGSGRRPPGGAADIWLIRYDPRRQSVDVKDGDNRGKTVVLRNVVVQVERLGPWKGRPVLLQLPPAPQEGLADLVLLQGHDGGRILGELSRTAPETH